MVVKETKSQRAEEKLRDAHGHFVHQNPPSPQQPQPPVSPLKSVENLLAQNVHYSKTQDDLLDVHVGNPLKKIALLLEDIKKQKAFSFSIKGSLGIMGVLLVAGTFGVLGIGNVLCDKGAQTRVGVLQTLVYRENSSTSLLDLVPFIDSFLPKQTVGRTVLLTPDNQIIHVVLKNNVVLPTVNREQITNNISFFLTGAYDSCSQTMTISDATGVQLYSKQPQLP